MFSFFFFCCWSLLHLTCKFCEVSPPPPISWNTAQVLMKVAQDTKCISASLCSVTTDQRQRHTKWLCGYRWTWPSGSICLECDGTFQPPHPIPISWNLVWVLMINVAEDAKSISVPLRPITTNQLQCQDRTVGGAAEGESDLEVIHELVLAMQDIQ